MDFGLLLGSPGDHFGGHLGARVSNLERLCRFFYFFGASKKERKNYPKSSKRSLLGGSRHGSSVVNSSKNLVFHVFKQTPFFFTFGSIFCSILESFWEPSSSLYSFWSPGWPKQAHKTQAKKQRNKSYFLGSILVPKWWILGDMPKQGKRGLCSLGLARERYYITSRSCS